MYGPVVKTAAHPVLVHLALEQDTLAYAALAIVVTRVKLGVVTCLLERVVEVSVDEELDALLNGNLVTPDCLIHLGLFRR